MELFISMNVPPNTELPVVDRLMCKLHAARALTRMMRWLSNWKDVWVAYRSRFPLPPLRFRAGFVMHHDVGDDPIFLLDEIFVGKAYRRHIQAPIKGIMVDLGANIGATTLDLAIRYPNLRILAYEPNPKTYKTLHLNVVSNGLDRRIQVYNEAVGRTSGEFGLWTDLPSVLANGYSNVLQTTDATKINVPMVNLNEVVRRISPESIALLKVDVEGAEAEILEGASLSTLKLIGEIILEYHNNLCPDALSRCQQILDAAGFEVRIIPDTDQIGMLHAMNRGERLVG